MKTRHLGNSGIEVSEIGFGSWLTYAGGIEREQTPVCTKAAFDLGITFFDTANVYGHGAPETAWGEVLSGYPRSSDVLATKVWAKKPVGLGLTAAQVPHQFDATLKRLSAETIEVYYYHRFDPLVPVSETLGVLPNALRAGKVQATGVLEWTAEQIQAALVRLDLDTLERIETSLGDVPGRKPRLAVFAEPGLCTSKMHRTAS